MKHVFLTSVFFVLSTLASHSALSAWEPTFVDNFGGNSLKDGAWAQGRENLVRRINFYDEDAVRVRNGVLEINVLNRAESDRPYTTGAVTTQGIFKQKYGYFEIRAKIPNDNGYWPSFWLMPESGQWSSEIDIAEFRGFAPTTVHNAFHHGNRLRPENEKTSDVGINFSTSFNNFAVRWRPNRIDYLVNGQIVHSVTDATAVSAATDEMYLILNMAMASQYSGWIPTVNASTDLNQRFEVDYVRVYREIASGTYANIPAPTASVPDLIPAAYDNTALSLNHVSGSPDIMRTPGRVSGRFEATSHKANYSGKVLVFLHRITSFNSGNGRYDKTAPLEELNFDLNMNNIGDTTAFNYQFNTFIQDPAAYIVDITIRDNTTGNKKRLAAARVVQYVDTSEPSTTLALQGFFRPGSASYANGQVSAVLPLQLQEALVAPYVRLNYRLVNTNTNQELASYNQTLEHDSVGLQSLTPTFSINLNTSDSVGLVVVARNAANSSAIAQYATGISGTVAPPSNWNPFANGGGNNNGGGTQPPDLGTIPILDWEPAFVDNFSGNSLRANAWRPGWEHVRRRINYYDKDALRVSNGRLYIDALTRGEADRGYTTGAVTTQGIFKQQYGYFEIRAKIPSGESFWPAFWLMPETGRWTSEIDIAEFRGHLPGQLHSAFHYNNRLQNQHSGDASAGKDLSQSFNNYAVYWTPQRIDYLYNGTIVHSIVGSSTVANASDEMFMILDLAMASQHASGWIPVATRDTNINQSFEIDYVRVYRQANNGRYRGIPAPGDSVPDLIPAAYDQTALSVDRVELPGESDIVRNGQSISGRVELTSHRDNYNGTVSVFLTRMQGFNTSNGEFSKSAALETRNYSVSLPNAGSTTTIDYDFNTTPALPGVYSIDVLVRDPSNGNKYNFGGHRVIQFVTSSQPNSGVFFGGFIRNLSADYSNGQVSGTARVQLQQATLVPYLRVNYAVLNSAGSVIAQGQNNHQHESLGLIDIPLSFAASIANTSGHSLRVSVSDPQGNSVGELSTALGSGGGTQPPTEPPAGEATLHGVTVNGTSGTLDVTLPGIQGSDSLNYNVKIYNGSTLVQKRTGNAGSGFSAGRFDIPFTLGSALNAGTYRAVVFVFRGGWSDRVLYDNIDFNAGSGGGSNPPSEPPVSGENTLHGASIDGSTLNLDLTLAGIQSSDTLNYNVKVFSGATRVGKFTGSAGNGFSAGRFTLPVNMDSNLSSGNYKLVVHIYRNGWAEQIFFTSQTLDLGSGGSNPPTTPPPAGESSLNSAALSGQTLNLSMNLQGISAGQALLYNIKLYNGGQLLQKLTGSAGNSFSSGDVSLPLPVSSAATAANRVVVIIYAENWNSQILYAPANLN